MTLFPQGYSPPSPVYEPDEPVVNRERVKELPGPVPDFVKVRSWLQGRYLQVWPDDELMPNNPENAFVCDTNSERSTIACKKFQAVKSEQIELKALEVQNELNQERYKLKLYLNDVMSRRVQHLKWKRIQRRRNKDCVERKFRNKNDVENIFEKLEQDLSVWKEQKRSAEVQCVTV